MNLSTVIRAGRPSRPAPASRGAATGLLSPILRRSDDPAMAVVTISALCEATGASSRALRHYEDVGLLSPVRSRGNGRLFTPHQCALAALIVGLRRFDVAIADLPPLIDLDRPDAERLHDVRVVLERRAAELALGLSEIHDVLSEGQACRAHADCEAPTQRRLAG